MFWTIKTLGLAYFLTKPPLIGSSVPKLWDSSHGSIELFIHETSIGSSNGKTMDQKFTNHGNFPLKYSSRPWICGSMLVFMNQWRYIPWKNNWNKSYNYNSFFRITLFLLIYASLKLKGAYGHSMDPQNRSFRYQNNYIWGSIIVSRTLALTIRITSHNHTHTACDVGTVWIHAIEIP